MSVHKLSITELLFAENFPQIPSIQHATQDLKAIQRVIDRFCMEVVGVGSERYVGGGSTDSGDGGGAEAGDYSLTNVREF